MAVSFKDAIEKLLNSPLTASELGWIQETEKHIDERITNDFDGKTFYLKSELIEFHQTPNGASINVKSTRKKLMQTELIKRYDDVGWSIIEESDGYYSFGEKK